VIFLSHPTLFSETLSTGFLFVCLFFVFFLFVGEMLGCTQSQGPPLEKQEWQSTRWQGPPPPPISHLYHLRADLSAIRSPPLSTSTPFLLLGQEGAAVLSSLDLGDLEF
jgi:hypothetical protein